MRRLPWIAFGLFPALVCAQLRVAAWNISNYNGGRVADIQNVVYAQFQGRLLSPDVLVCEEIISASAQTTLLTALNTAPGSPGTWAAAPFTDGPDTDSSFFYRTDRVQFLAETTFSFGGASPLPPRNTKRFDVRLLGYGVLQPKIAVYGAHMKAGSAADDEARRLVEATRIRTNAETLTGFDGFIVCGDFNTYSSSDDGYTKLTESETNNSGRVFDPISTPGGWDNVASYRFVHTQDPSNFGMDSRFDFVLLSGSLRDSSGFDYLGNPTVPYSTVTWNDPNHSYRAWGNDGTSFNALLTVNGNTMVGPTIAQAIVNAATSAGGHVPVFLDLRTPAELGTSATSFDFGTVVQGSTAARILTVSNTTSTTVWRTGIADLFYRFTPTQGFDAPAGTFTDPAGGGGNDHDITMDTSTPGVKSGSVLVDSAVAGTNAVNVALQGQVVPDELTPSAISPDQNTTLTGALSDLFQSDDLRVDLANAAWATQGRGEPAVAATVSATSPVPAVSSITLRLESHTNGLIQEVSVWDAVAAAWVVLDSRSIGGTDTPISLTVPSPERVLNPSNGALSMRLRYFAGGSALPRVARASVDKAVWVLR